MRAYVDHATPGVAFWGETHRVDCPCSFCAGVTPPGYPATAPPLTALRAAHARLGGLSRGVCGLIDAIDAGRLTGLAEVRDELAWLIADEPNVSEDDMPYRDNDGAKRPYAWDSPQAAWEGLVRQSVVEYFSQPSAEYEPSLFEEFRAYLDAYRDTNGPLAGMTGDERDAAARLLADYAADNR